MTITLMYVPSQTVQESSIEDDGMKNKIKSRVRKLENKILQNIFQQNDILNTKSLAQTFSLTVLVGTATTV